MKKKWLVFALVGIAGLVAAGFMRWPHKTNLVVHEWGTFTSLQSSDGVLLKWNPLKSSALPGFVYNWQHAGLGRYPSGMLALGAKNALVALQRMETPVIYFYSKAEQTVDLTVRFPKGGITEWYPQAPEIGPSFIPAGPVISKLDSGLHRSGVSGNFTLASVFGDPPLKESLIHWTGLKLLPNSQHPEAAKLAPTDSSGSHYFSARQTDSDYVVSPSFCPTNSRPECEKFLFYRGVGNFTTPLNVQIQSDGKMMLENQGQCALGRLFVLEVNDHAAVLHEVEGLKAGEQRRVSLDPSEQDTTKTAVHELIREQMKQALIAAGLYPREATAMVNTWADSWFAEEGVRVLYILPRSWTDQTLPMTLNPKPGELVRVMVGRAEVITPQLEQSLQVDIKGVQRGEAGADREILQLVRGLGRFAEPILGRAMDRAELRSEDRVKVNHLLYDTHFSRK